MAITSIVGFQQFKDYLNVQFSDFPGLGNIPFLANNYGRSNRMYFQEVNGRVWFSSIGWYYDNQDLERGASLKIPFTSVYDKCLEGNHSVFWIGFRYYRENNGRTPNVLLHLVNGGGNTPGTGFPVLTNADIPSDGGQFFYYEVKLDLDLGIVSRWRDGIRLDDLSVESGYLDTDLKVRHWYMGERQRYQNKYRDLWLNDFYFMVDTRQDEDGLPSTRLGQVEVEPLIVEEVVLPEDWKVPEATNPVELVGESFDTDAMRGVPVVETSSDETVAEFKYARPDVGEGEVLLVDVEIYGHRDFGDNVELNTQVVAAEGEVEAINHELEPERLKVNERYLKPGHLYKAPDGTPWDEDKLANLSLKVWSTKLEEG